MYEYKAEVVRVIDGDTVEVVLDLGFHVKIQGPLRMYGINTPELHSKDAAERERAKAAKAFLESVLPKQFPILCHTKLRENDKYGRILATLFVDGVNINQRMVELGHAVPYLLN